MAESETDDDRILGWEITAIIPDDKAVGSGRYEVFTVDDAESQEEAERMVKQKDRVRRIDSSATVQFERRDNGQKVY